MECFKIAVREVKYLDPGEKFLVKDLFKGYEWNRLPIGDRRSLGSLFLHEVRDGDLKEVITIDVKSSANQQQYIKK